MKNKLFALVRSEIRKTGNGNVTFKAIKRFIEAAQNKRLALIMVYFLLKDNPSSHSSTWNRWYTKFTLFYQKELATLGLEDSPENTVTFVRTEHPEEVIEAFGLLLKSGAFPGYTSNEIAQFIQSVFHLNWSIQTISSKLRDYSVK